MKLHNKIISALNYESKILHKLQIQSYCAISFSYSILVLFDFIDFIRYFWFIKNYTN